MGMKMLLHSAGCSSARAAWTQAVRVEGDCATNTMRRSHSSAVYSMRRAGASRRVRRGVRGTSASGRP